MEIGTQAGPAEAQLDKAAEPRFLLVLTHGAAGGIDAPDLLAARGAALRLGGTVARVLQPYRVRGARAPGSAQRQDQAWLRVIDALRGAVPAVPLVQGGRSNGARLACRTAAAASARAVLALAFPLHPPGRPERSRIGELHAAGTDVLVISGARDPFGVPGTADAARVIVLPGEAHSLARHPEAVGDAVGSWLRVILRLADGSAAPG
ncbi:MAG TPA: alpha/beta family hydrolase [Streptosporangiaceae bacterium]|nr:alpha/beta family hydrolase [Streptosporangiaceae bacterium]